MRWRRNIGPSSSSPGTWPSRNSQIVHRVFHSTLSVPEPLRLKLRSHCFEPTHTRLCGTVIQSWLGETGAIDPTTSRPDTHRLPSRRVQTTRARLRNSRPVWVLMRRSHMVPAESHSRNEIWIPVLLTSRADAVCWIGDAISISASEGQRSARRRSVSRAAGRTSDFWDVGGASAGCFDFLELIDCCEGTGRDMGQYADDDVCVARCR